MVDRFKVYCPLPKPNVKIMAKLLAFENKKGKHLMKEENPREETI